MIYVFTFQTLLRGFFFVVGYFFETYFSLIRHTPVDIIKNNFKRLKQVVIHFYLLKSCTKCLD